MHFQALLIAAVSATAIAQDSAFASLTSDLASLTSDLATLSFDLPTTEVSVLSVLATAIPSTLLTALDDPQVISSLQSDFSAGNTPSWYSNLPSDVKSYINSADAAASETLSSAEASLSAAVSSARSSADSRLSAASTSASTSRPAATRASDAASSTSSLTGGAPAPTGAIFASMAGVVGVLALAVGL